MARHTWNSKRSKATCSKCGIRRNIGFIPALYWNADGTTYHGEGAPKCTPKK